MHIGLSESDAETKDIDAIFVRDPVSFAIDT